MRRWRASLALWMMLAVAAAVVAALTAGHMTPTTFTHSSRSIVVPSSNSSIVSATAVPVLPTTRAAPTADVGTTSPVPAASTVTTVPVTSTTTTSNGASSQSGASDATSTTTLDWECIRLHESGDDYAEHGGGAYQFESGTWEAVTGLSGTAQTYPPTTQDAAALKLHAERGFEPWTTRTLCGL